MRRGEPGEGRRYGRRAFLAAVGGGLSSLYWGPWAWRHVSGALGPIVPEALRRALPAPGGGWRIYSVAPTMPGFDPVRWRLSIEGLVERPQTISYAELRALPRAEQVSDFHCVTGWSVSNVRWAGVRFRDLLGQAGPLSSARALVFVSAERPYVDSLTLEQAYIRDAMLAYELDGKPLSRAHGAPARVVIPEMYGYKGVKWVERIVVTERPIDGYWELRGYDRNAWVGRSNGYAA